jgi:hypothetical protein
LREKVGSGGFPSGPELVAMLQDVNEDAESEYSNILKAELQALDSRIKSELARLDLRINATE